MSTDGFIYSWSCVCLSLTLFELTAVGINRGRLFMLFIAVMDSLQNLSEEKQFWYLYDVVSPVLMDLNISMKPKLCYTFL